MPKSEILFLDTEFTGLHQQTQLISLALYRDDSCYFYAEFSDYSQDDLTGWLRDKVIKKLDFNEFADFFEQDGKVVRVKNTRKIISQLLTNWISQFEFLEICADVLAYDWVLFCELFGGAMSIPGNIFYAPIELATLLRAQGVVNPVLVVNKETKRIVIEGDKNRFEFAGFNKEQEEAMQHHALNDCRVEKICFEKLMS